MIEVMFEVMRANVRVLYISVKDEYYLNILYKN